MTTKFTPGQILADRILQVAGSGLKNYTMDLSRQKIFDTAKVHDDLYAALEEATEIMAEVCSCLECPVCVRTADFKILLQKARGEES